MRPFVGDVIVVSSVFAAVRRVIVSISSDEEASDWEFSIVGGLSRFLCSLLEAI